MRKQAYLLGREMIWSDVAHRYMESFQQARHEPRRTSRSSRWRCARSHEQQCRAARTGGSTTCCG